MWHWLLVWKAFSNGQTYLDLYDACQQLNVVAAAGLAIVKPFVKKGRKILSETHEFIVKRRESRLKHIHEVKQSFWKEFAL